MLKEAGVLLILSVADGVMLRGTMGSGSGSDRFPTPEVEKDYSRHSVGYKGAHPVTDTVKLAPGKSFYFDDPDVETPEGLTDDRNWYKTPPSNPDFVTASPYGGSMKPPYVGPLYGWKGQHATEQNTPESPGAFKEMKPQSTDGMNDIVCFPLCHIQRL